MSEPLKIRKEGDCMRVSGRIDVDNAADALARGRACLAEGRARVDIGALESADSVTLAVLLAWAARSSAGGAALEYVGMSSRLLSLAHLSDVDSLLGTSRATSITNA